ncbi:MAG TPA: PASTA domain-containing protein [Nocardioidaceae bacterium]|nr:PASTA domain-containing protein [Nocardioidaceae bacterium]
MNDDDATTLLNRLAERVPVGAAPVEEVIRSGQKARVRHRRTTVLAVAAGVAIVLIGGFAVRQALQPARVTPVAGRPDTGPAAPAGTRLVGIGQAAIAVPEDWGTNQTRCGQPQTNTVVIDQGVVPLCAIMGPQTASDVELQIAPEAPSNFATATPTSIDGVVAMKTPLRCTSEGSFAANPYQLCTESLWVQQERALFTVTSPHASTVRRLLASVRVHKGYVAVPFTYSAGATRDVRSFTEAARAEGLQVQTRLDRTSSSPAGWIVDVDPAVGSMLRPGATVQVTVSSGAGPQSGQGTAPPATTTAAACPLTSNVQRVLVTRTAAAGNGLTFDFPRRVTVRDPAAISQVVSALCAAPPVPRGAVYHCPNDIGPYYRLAAFDGSPKPAWTVDIDATGCRTIGGIGNLGRWTTGRMWHALAAAMGVRPPTYQTLAGHPSR